MHECAHIFHSSCLQILPKSILSTLLLFYRFCWLVCCCMCVADCRVYIVNLLARSLSLIHVISNIFLLVLFIRQICDYYLLWWFCCSLTRPINFRWIWYGISFDLFIRFFSSFPLKYMPISALIFICFIEFFLQYIKYCDNLYDQSVWCSDQEYLLLWLCFGESIIEQSVIRFSISDS